MGVTALTKFTTRRLVADKAGLRVPSARRAPHAGGRPAVERRSVEARRRSMKRQAAAALIAVVLAGSALGSAGLSLWPSAAADSVVGSWSVLGEHRVSRRPTTPRNRSREPIVAAHPFDASRLAVVFPQGGEKSRPVIRISHDGGKTWRTAAGRPRGGGSHPMVAWGPGPGPAGPASTTPRWAARFPITSRSATATTRGGPGDSASSPTTHVVGVSASRTWSSTRTRRAPTTARSTSPTTGRRIRQGRWHARGRLGRLRAHVRRDGGALSSPRRPATGTPGASATSWRPRRMGRHTWRATSWT